MAGRKPQGKSATRKKKSAGGGKTSWRRVVLWVAFDVAFWVTLAAVVIGGLYAFSIDKDLREKFEGKRWKLPSHVYSDSLTVIPGTSLRASDLLGKLERLNYQPVEEKPSRPGEYRKSEGTLDIYLREFDYPGETVKPRLVRLTLGGDAITRIMDLASGEQLYLLEIEPELIGRFFGQVQEERRLVPWEAIPKTVVWSVVAVEDAAFFHHHGMNFKGLARALVKGIVRLSFREGGSSITQQLVKNLYLSPERTISRKLTEAVMALVLEMHYPKEKIFEVYINEIYFGQSGTVSICGLGEASRFYFGKDPEELTLPEAALIAGLIRSPAGYNPRKHEDRTRVRRDYILDRLAEMPEAMRELGVTREELAAAKTEELSVDRHLPPRTIAPYFIEFLRQQLVATYGEDVLQSEGLRIYTTLDVATQRMAEAAVTETLTQLEENNKSLQVTDENKLQAAMVVLEPSTGYVRGMVGGRNYQSSPFNRAVQMQRQVGSVFKPFVYTAAFVRSVEDADFHFTGATIVKDEAFSIPSGGKTWSPKNYDHKFLGPITVRRALEGSRNVPTARVALDVGIDRVIEVSRRMGLTADLPPYPALALGIAETSPLEIGAAFATLANQGYYNEPIAVRDVVDQTGRVLEKRSVKPRRAVPSTVAYLMTHLLEGVIDHGTAAGARRLGLRVPAAGKTGTTNDAKDAWFVGYTPQILAAVWVGFDRQRNVGLTGAGAALPAWTRFMLAYHGDQPGVAFEPPPGIVYRKICEADGLLAHFNCPDVEEEAFIEGTEPTEETPLFRDDLIEFFRGKEQ